MDFTFSDQQDLAVYYDAFVPNSNSFPVPARFTSQQSRSILNDARGRSCAIERFTVPATSIPIRNYNTVDYVITFRYNGVDYSSVVPYISFNLLDPTVALYSIFQFLNMVNDALSALYIASLATLADPLFPGGGEPFLTFDNTTRMFSIYFLNGSWTSDNVNGATLFFSDVLYQMFYGLPAKKTNILPPTNLVWQMISSNFKGINVVTINAKNYNKMDQNFSSLWSWPDVVGVVIVSNSPTTKLEYVNNPNTLNSLDNQRAILTNFEAIVTNNFLTESVYQYQPQGGLRFMDLIGENFINLLDFQVFYKNKQGLLFPLLINANSYFSFRLKFVKKNKLVFN